MARIFPVRPGSCPPRPAASALSGSPFEFGNTAGVIDSVRTMDRAARARRGVPAFDKDDPSIRWGQKDKLWGLARADGSWLIEPKFKQVDPLVDGLARVHGQRQGRLHRPNREFRHRAGLRQGMAVQARLRAHVRRSEMASFGVIDKTGAWVFRTNYQQIHFATACGKDRNSETVFGWHFKKADRWGLLDLDGRVVLDAEFDQPIKPLRRWPAGRATRTRNGSISSRMAARCSRRTAGSSTRHAAALPPYTLKIGDKFGLVDANSSPLDARAFRRGRPRAGRDARNVKIDGKWGRIGPTAAGCSSPDSITSRVDLDIFVASIDGKRGFMRSDGTWLIEPRFDAAARRRHRSRPHSSRSPARPAYCD